MAKQDYRRKTARGGRSGSASLKNLPSGGKISNGPDKMDYEEDPLHNNEIPFCQLLAQLAHEIIPIQENRTTSSDGLGGRDLSISQCKQQKHLDSGLSTLIRDYLLGNRRKQRQSSVNEAAGSKKKRKSRKKKNDKVQNILQGTDQEDAEDDNKTRISGSNEVQVQDSRVTETSDFDDNDPLNVWNNTLDRFLDDCCTSLDSSTANELIASTTNDKNSLPAFLASMLPAANGGHHPPGNGVTSSNGSSKNGKKSLVTDHGGGGCHVQLEEAQTAVAAIVCPTCQSAVRKAFLNDLAIPVRSPIDAFPNMKGNESEAAFDYVAMEEGIGTGVSPIVPDDPDQLVFQLVKLKNNQYENSNDLEASSGWILGRNLALDDSKKTISSCTTDDVISIIQQYVIMTGFHPDTLTGAVPLSDEVISSISDSVDSQVSSVSKEFRDLAKELEVQVEVFVTQQGADHSHCNDNPNFVNFGMHTFPIIKETDLLCCAIMERVLKLILGITRTAQRIVSYNANVMPSPDDALAASQWAIHPCIRMWQEFWDGVATCAGHIESYEQELFGFCDRLGNIPAMYLNSQSRNAYRTLVDSKIRLVHKMMSLEEKIVNGQTNVNGYGCEGWSTSFMRKAFTVESFYEVLIGMDESKRNLLHSTCIDSTFDKSCQDVLKFVTTACSKTILIGNSKQIIDTRKSDLANVATLLRIIPFVSTSGSLLQTVHLMQNNVNKLSSDEVEKWTNFCPLMTQFSSNWIMESTKSSQRATDCMTVPPMMPLKLRQSMVMSDPGRQVMKSGYQCHGGCDSNNGKIRAVGVLVGLFLKGWLVERYREWNARLAEEELLITLASETAADGSSSGSQLRATTTSNVTSIKGDPVAKKTKKKKNKKSETESVPIEAEHVGEQALDDLSSSHLCNGTTNGSQLPSIVESLSVSSADKNSFISASDGSIDRPTVHANDELVEGSATETRCDPTESSGQDNPPVLNGDRDGIAQIGVEHVENEPKFALGSEQFSIQDVEAKVNVLVYSTNGFLSAERFLLERFKLVLEERS